MISSTKVVANVFLQSGKFRKYTTAVSSKLVNVSFNEKTGVATVNLQRPPVNSLNLDLLSDISKTLDELEKNRTRGMILTSSGKSVFSAGLDITEMYKPDPTRCKHFWTNLQDVWIKLYGSTFPTVAVINGHSPAGGCLLAMSCEYRIMLPKFTIGLNETQLGIIAPKWFIASMQNTIGLRQTELALTRGKLFQTDEAIQIGLIDEIAKDKEEGLIKAETFLNTFSRIPFMARALTKKSLRQQAIEDLSFNREKDVDVFLKFVGQDKVQQGLEIYLESLKQKANQ